MNSHLLMAVHLHADGMGTARYHGVHQDAPEWPPSPARVFQALVAGVARGQSLPEACVQALQWLENLPPPIIATPSRTLGQAVQFYVPNNDADALSNPADVGSIRTAKQAQASLFDGGQALLYAWPLPEDHAHAGTVAQAAQSLYQLGRGLDMAWAETSVVTDEALQLRLRQYRGTVHQPGAHAATPQNLACPQPGSLKSLVHRHQAPRLRTEGQGRQARVLFTNAPKPRFAAVAYGTPQHQMLYDLRERSSTAAWPWPQQRAVALVEQLRDAAAARLQQALPGAAADIARCLIGRTPEGQGAVPLAQRVRIVPLPSIGSTHADQAIRRVLVEVPSACPLSAQDLAWAFSGLEAVDPLTGELSPWVLTPAAQSDMQRHYSQATRHWQSVTPLALPAAAGRRRLDPAHQQAQAKPASERLNEEASAVAAVHQALRQAGVAATAVQVQVQREPFTGHGQRAEAWAADTRFAKERLWHVALSLDKPVQGPMVVGDGRFLGLGVLAPTLQATGFSTDPASWTGGQSDGVVVLQMQVADNLANAPDDAPNTAHLLARALRRAVMARVHAISGRGPNAALPPYFSGHAEDGPAPDAKAARHLAFHWDPPRQRWLVLAPHRLAQRAAEAIEAKHLSLLDQALEGLTQLRAGAAGVHDLCRVVADTDDVLLRPALAWQSVTPYTVTRHRRMASAAEAVVTDVLAECQRLALPTPVVTVSRLRSVPKQGLQALVRLQFTTAVAGPLAMGRTALLGGGLFSAAP